MMEVIKVCDPRVESCDTLCSESLCSEPPFQGCDTLIA